MGWIKVGNLFIVAKRLEQLSTECVSCEYNCCMMIIQQLPIFEDELAFMKCWKCGLISCGSLMAILKITCLNLFYMTSISYLIIHCIMQLWFQRKIWTLLWYIVTGFALLSHVIMLITKSGQLWFIINLSKIYGKLRHTLYNVHNLSVAN